jgi:DNA-binding LacI/PurR family transcriptional regulator
LPRAAETGKRGWNAKDFSRRSNGKPGSGVTIETVAAEAGVSKTTVSFVLNGNESISEATRLRILEVIERLGYQPNTNARNLSARINQTLCVVLPELGHVFEDQYFARTLSGIYDEIEARGYRLLLKKASYEFASAKEYLHLFQRKEIGGMLYLGSTLEDTYLADFLETDFPFVLVNSVLPGLDLPNVIADYRHAGLLATRHLIELGHRRIAHVQGSWSTFSARERQAGYEEALGEAGIPFDKSLIVEGHFDREEAARGVERLMGLARPPTAIFASNDVMAVGALEVLRRMKIRMPASVSVIGGDRTDASTMMTPPLTSVEQPVYEIARESVRLLIDLIEGRESAVRRLQPSYLVLGESTAAAPDAATKRTARARRSGLIEAVNG